MRVPVNTYVPVTLAANEVREFVVEETVSTLPLYEGSVLLRNIEDATEIGVTADTMLVVTDAGIGFDGEWSNRYVDSVIAAEGSLVIKLAVSCADASYLRHVVTLTNPTGATRTLHMLINGSTESVRPPPTPTYVVIP